MLETHEVKDLYKEIQNRLFYMIPEKWEKLCLYASVIEQIKNVPTGELYFYYFPKGILKRNPVNAYEIPSMFNINEEEYLQQMRSLYELIKELWEEFVINEHRRWYSVTITIENFKFKVEYNYEDLRELPYNQEQLHTIWTYKHLNPSLDTLPKKSRKLIERYLEEGVEEVIESYEEMVYKKPSHNIISYQKITDEDKGENLEPSIQILVGKDE